MKKANKYTSGMIASFCFVIAAVLTAIAVGDELAPQPADVPVVGGGLLTWLENAGKTVAPEWLFVIGAVVLDIVLRLFKTKKPLSILYFVRNFCVYVARALDSAARTLDKLLQRTKEDGDTTNPPPRV